MKVYGGCGERGRESVNGQPFQQIAPVVWHRVKIAHQLRPGSWICKLLIPLHTV